MCRWAAGVNHPPYKVAISFCSCADIGQTRTPVPTTIIPVAVSTIVTRRGDHWSPAYLQMNYHQSRVICILCYCSDGQATNDRPYDKVQPYPKAPSERGLSRLDRDWGSMRELRYAVSYMVNKNRLCRILLPSFALQMPPPWTDPPASGSFHQREAYNVLPSPIDFCHF